MSRVENLCHNNGCERPSCCYQNSLIVYRNEIRYFSDAMALSSMEEYDKIKKANPDSTDTFVIEQQTIMDHPSQYLIIFPNGCMNLTPEGNCQHHGSIAACGPNTSIGGPECSHCRQRDGLPPITIPLNEIK